VFLTASTRGYVKQYSLMFSKGLGQIEEKNEDKSHNQIFTVDYNMNGN
jgi:hypothetical protein